MYYLCNFLRTISIDLVFRNQATDLHVRNHLWKISISVSSLSCDEPEISAYHHSARPAHTASQGTSCCRILSSTAMFVSRKLDEYLSRYKRNSQVSCLNGFQGDWCEGSTRTDRRVDNSPRSSWCIRLVIVRGEECPLMVARFDVDMCRVSIDGVDSKMGCVEEWW